MQPAQLASALGNEQAHQMGSLVLFMQAAANAEAPQTARAIAEYSLPLSTSIHRLKAIKVAEILEATEMVTFGICYPLPSGQVKQWHSGSYECVLPDPSTQKIGPVDLERDYVLHVEEYDPSKHSQYATLPIFNGGSDYAQIPALPLNATDRSKPRLEWRYENGLAGKVQTIFLCSLYHRYPSISIH